MIPNRPFRVDTTVFEDTLAALREVGNRGFECFGLWLGTVEPDEVHIGTLQIPAQRSSHVSEGCQVTVDGDELFRISVLAHELNQLVCAQVHSHPGLAYHSNLDDVAPLVSIAGALSIVVPNFADDPLDLAAWATFRLQGDGSWQELDTCEWIRVTD